MKYDEVMQATILLFHKKTRPVRYELLKELGLTAQ